MTEPIEVLLIDDEAIVCERLEEYLTGKGVGVEAFTDSAEALARLGEKSFDVVITDLKMDGPTGMDVLRFLREKHPTTPGIVITAFGVLESVREAEVLEAFEVVHKPFRLGEVHKLVLKAAKVKRKRQDAKE